MSIYFIFVVLFFHFAGHKPQVMNKTADVGLGPRANHYAAVCMRRGRPAFKGSGKAEHGIWVCTLQSFWRLNWRRKSVIGARKCGTCVIHHPKSQSHFCFSWVKGVCEWVCIRKSCAAMKCTFGLISWKVSSFYVCFGYYMRINLQCICSDVWTLM